MMNSKNLVLSLVTFSLWTVACQKMTVSGAGDADSASSGLAVSCKTETGYVDPSLLQIEGAAVAHKGDPVTYQLNEDLGCSSSQKVSWKTIGNGSVVKTGSAMKSSFQKAGEYVIVAQVEGQNLEGAIGNQKASDISSSSISFKTTVVADAPVVSGPVLAMVGTPASYSIAMPSGVNLSSAAWDFGDASAIVNSSGVVSHTFSRPGDYQISVNVTDSNQVQRTISHQVTVLMIQDGLECVSDLAISGASEAIVGVPVSMSLFIPSCLTSKITAVVWNFGDGGTSGDQSVQHTYQAAGNYQVTVQIFIGDSTTPWVTLSHDMSVSVPAPEPTPSPSPEPTATPVPSVTPSPTPSPTPVNPNACSVSGATRSSQSELYSEVIACGIDGTKNMSYRDVIVEQCKLVGEVLEWSQISKTKQLQNEGACQGQSCKMPDGSTLTNGSTRNDVITGEVSVAKTCQYGEQGYFDLFNQVSDQTCRNTQLVSSNTRKGTLKLAGSCPTYSYVPSDSWTACSADCGGKQSRIYSCKDNLGAVAPAERCAGVAPVEERLCDGNPAAVRREEKSVAQEDANSSEKCPANQIGVVAKSRDVTTTTTFACIAHSVQKEKTEVTYGAWVTEKYCRDYVAHRCSQDSLSNSEAVARYKWMVKCQDQVPVIKEFLTNFTDVGIKISGVEVEIDSTKGRLLYPTFLNRATNPEKPWIAPKVATASCTVPSTIYIAAVCVSSCATPEQQILADEQAKGGTKYVSFIDALTKNYSYVATLKSDSAMNSKSIEKTKVEQWVTELLDGDHDIIVFKMQSGRSLKLTPNHPLLASDGLMKAAGDFKVGDKLVNLGGALDPIVSLNHMNHYGKVYNLFVQSADVKKNIVVTNGYLNGTAFFQNQGSDNMNRQLFKNKMLQGVFAK